MTKTEILAIAKPILFNTEMVRAILEGRKTVTRRVVNPRYRADEQGFQVITTSNGKFIRVEKIDENECGIFADGTERVMSQPCYAGNYLYVRETWLFSDCFGMQNGYMYYANAEQNRAIFENTSLTPKWHPSIHMPKEAARLFLRVTGVRVERLQDMDPSQCVREGTTWTGYPCVWTHEAKPAFIKLWDSTIEPADLDRYGWNANPWVWVIEFEKVTVNE